MPINEFEPFWLVWCENGDSPIYKHTTEKSAEKEAERLACKFTGTAFVVLEAKASCKKTVIEWSYPKYEVKIPF